MNCIIKSVLKKCIKKNIINIKVVNRYLRIYYNINLSEEAICLRMHQQQKNKGQS